MGSKQIQTRGVGVLMAVLVCGCSIGSGGAAERPDLPPVRCPNFSGTYSYPGVEHAHEVCTLGAGGGFGQDYSLPLPSRGARHSGHAVPSGGWGCVEAPAEIEIRQQDCTEISLSGPVTVLYHKDDYEIVMQDLEKVRGRYRYKVYPEASLPGYFRVDKWGTSRLQLDPTTKGAELTWGEDFLSYRFRFRAEGFGAGWSRNYLTLTLRKLPDGTLSYRLRHDQTGPGDHEIECRLAPVTAVHGPELSPPAATPPPE